MRFVDLSLPLDDNRGWAPWWYRSRVSRQGHRFGRLAMRALFGVGAGRLRHGLGWANEELRLSTHATTHLDAPWHYAPTTAGRPARRIDEVPLDWCYGAGVVLDLRHVPSGEAIRAADVQGALATIGHRLAPRELVLIWTGNSARFGTPAYFTDGPGMSAEATRWILGQGVKVTGIDSWTWDVPLAAAPRRLRRSREPGLFWEAHYVGAELEYCHLEGLSSLEQLPSTGFTLCCFPLRVRGGSAGPARVVALVDDARPPA